MAETVRVRVAVAVDADGDWHACGSEQDGDEAARNEATMYVRQPFKVYWLTADLPLPTEPEVAASVEGER